MSQANQTLLAGAASVDTTPPLGTIINGDFIPHYAKFIHDPLYAKALWLEIGETILVFVVVDICVMGQELINQAKALICKAQGLDPACIMVSSTHTHAAGAVEEVHLVAADLAYRKRVPEYIADAVALAGKKKQPAQLAFGTAQAPEHAVCRRFWMKDNFTSINPVSGEQDAIKTNPFGAEHQILSPVSKPDPELAFLAVRTLKDEWISVLANYSMHYVGDWESGTITADYFGTFSKALKQQLGAKEDFIGILSNGTSGDINIWDFLKEKKYPETYFAKGQLIGEDLAAKLVEQIAELTWETQPNLAYRHAVVEVKRRLPNEKELAEASEKVGRGDYENLQPNQEGWEYLYAREQVLLAGFPAVAKCPVQVFDVGPGCIGALPGEIFAETGLKIKKELNGKPYFTICLANGNLGYVPPLHELERGGYESWRCRISNLDGSAEETLRSKLLEMIRAVPS
ncbi:hypothetical protein SAMN04488057_10820 [Cyclobacterium lianum]|uniref:Neutral/alkaline non-lysosomal ceramidase, N-terminal n=1 Tax=Cyclobacterium lianum TaxID=388280 RepID=A0A1M7PCB8_9BACT|nr:hypothetical protein [Cyclobacterium lianum]SHN14513.1 hypothetical protein SAMN04488057_10820 [Cyclobacterium lianum]